MSELTDTLETLPAIAPAAVVESKEIDPEKLEKLRRIFSMRVSGKSHAEIMEETGLSRSTVFRYLQEYKELYLRELENTPQLHLIAAEIQKYDEIENAARENAATCGGMRDKSSFLKLALAAAAQRAKFLLDTGIISREPERIFSVVAEHKPDSMRDEPKYESSTEQLLSDIEQLVRHGRRL